MDQQLKQRLVGATVLVSLAVIFVPVILDGPREDWMPRSSTMPDAPDIGFRSALDLPLPAAGPPPDSAATGKPPAGLQQTNGAPQPEPAEPPAADRRAAPQPAAAAAKTASRTRVAAVNGASPAGGWYVQVGSFSKQENADGLRRQLQSAGFDTHVQPGGKPAARSYRVLVGPEQSRKAADGLKSRLQSQRKLQGLVVEVGSS